MIEIKEGRYFARMWFAGREGWDMMGALFRDESDSVWRLHYRICTHADDKVHESDDVKNWWRASWPSGSEAENVIAGAQQAMELAAAGTKLQLQTLFLNTDNPKEVTARLAEQDWAHFRKAPEELEGQSG